jgi:hypothetical protein
MHTALLDRYAAMLQLSLRMRDTAAAGNWEALPELEQSRSSIQAGLMRDDVIAWPPVVAEKKRALLEAILSANDETQRLAQKQLEDVRNAMESASVGQRLNKAYTQL